MSAQRRYSKGDRAGPWTLLRISTEDAGGRWIARCDCGAEALVQPVQASKYASCVRCKPGGLGTPPAHDGYEVLAAVYRKGWRVRCRGCGTESWRCKTSVQSGDQCRVCFERDLMHDLAGQTISGWKVIRRATAEESAHLCKTPTHWIAMTPCCKRAVIRSQQNLRRGHAQCADCRDAALRVPDHLRVCRWCSRRTDEVKGGHTPTECAACQRRACRNGRAEDGRPLYRQTTRGPRRVTV